MLFHIMFVLSLMGPGPIVNTATSRLEAADQSAIVVNPADGWTCADENIVCNNSERIECYCKAKRAE